MSTISIHLPDGSSKTLTEGATVYDVAAAIGTGLAKAAIAGRIDGNLVDLAAPVPDGSRVEIVTEKSADALDIIRHSTSHLMAQAVKELFPRQRSPSARPSKMVSTTTLTWRSLSVPRILKRSRGRWQSLPRPT